MNLVIRDGTRFSRMLIWLPTIILIFPINSQRELIPHLTHREYTKPINFTKARLGLWNFDPSFTFIHQVVWQRFEAHRNEGFKFTPVGPYYLSYNFTLIMTLSPFTSCLPRVINVGLPVIPPPFSTRVRTHVVSPIYSENQEKNRMGVCQFSTAALLLRRICPWPSLSPPAPQRHTLDVMYQTHHIPWGHLLVPAGSLLPTTSGNLQIKSTTHGCLVYIPEDGEDENYEGGGMEGNVAGG